MKLATKCIPYGDLPYADLKLATHMVARIYEKCPYLALLPNIKKTDTIELLTLQKMPGVIIKDGNITLRAGTEQYEREMLKLEKAFNEPTIKNLMPFSPVTVFIEKFMQIAKKFKSPNACINILGPFTVSQILTKADREQMLADKSYRKMFIQAVCVRALWFIEVLKAFSPKTVPIIMLEEPMLGDLGVVRKENEEITTDIVTNMLAKVVEKLKSAGAIVGVQCFKKCDWTVPINAGVDIISYDAYNNPNNLHVIKEELNEFVRTGGIINWAIVPVVSEDKVKSITADYLANRLFKTIENLFLEGVPLDRLYKTATVSLNSSTTELQPMFAEKIHLVANHLANRLAMKK